MPRKLKLEYDQPVVLHMMQLEGWPSETAYPDGGKRPPRQWLPGLEYAFYAEEGRFYLSDTQGALFAARLKARGIRPGDPVTVVKTRVANPNSTKPITEVIPTPWVPLEASE